MAVTNSDADPAKTELEARLSDGFSKNQNRAAQAASKAAIRAKNATNADLKRAKMLEKTHIGAAVGSLNAAYLKLRAGGADFGVRKPAAANLKIRVRTKIAAYSEA